MQNNADYNTYHISDIIVTMEYNDQISGEIRRRNVRQHKGNDVVTTVQSNITCSTEIALT